MHRSSALRSELQSPISPWEGKELCCRRGDRFLLECFFFFFLQGKTLPVRNPSGEGRKEPSPALGVMLGSPLAEQDEDPPAPPAVRLQVQH